MIKLPKMYQKIKNHVPQLLNAGVLLNYLYSFKKYAYHSSVVKENSSTKLVSRIIADYHVIEKGLTMPDVRLGFGRDRLIQLIDNCNKFLNNYGLEDEQVIVAIGVVKEYKEFHKRKGYNLADDLVKLIDDLIEQNIDLPATKQKFFTRGSYYQNRESGFDLFAQSRLSLRNFSEEEISLIDIEKAVQLAKSAPSSCNRQTTRVHVYSDKERIQRILEIQGGNRGFGHLANKLIILTSDLGCWHGVSEINAPYVDGGIFAMNLLHSLHFYGIGSCPLNCNLSITKEKRLRKICGIPEEEVFIVMISCGKIPEKFETPASKRYSHEKIMKIHEN